MSNTWLKLYSLIGAVALAAMVNYFFVNADGNASVLQFIVPVEIKNVPPGKMIIWPPVRQAEVTIQGPSLFISRIAAAPPVFQVSLPQDVQNRYVAPLLREGLSLPPYIQVVSVKPRELELTLDTVIKREIPVVVPKIGALPETLKLDSLTVTPDHLDVSGPETEVKPIAVLETAPFDLRDVKENGKRELEIRPLGSSTEIDQRKVVVSYEVSVVQGEALFENLPIEMRSVEGDGLHLNPEVATVLLAGPREQVRQLTRNDIVPYVRLAGQEDQTAKVAVDVPRSISVLKIQPESVTAARPTPTPQPKRTVVSPPAGRTEKGKK